MRVVNQSWSLLLSCELLTISVVSTALFLELLKLRLLFRVLQCTGIRAEVNNLQVRLYRTANMYTRHHPAADSWRRESLRVLRFASLQHPRLFFELLVNKWFFFTIAYRFCVTFLCWPRCPPQKKWNDSQTSLSLPRNTHLMIFRSTKTIPLTRPDSKWPRFFHGCDTLLLAFM